MNVLQPPAIYGDDRWPPSPAHRQERRIVWNLLHQLQEQGWKPYAVDDGGDEDEVTPTVEEAFEAIFAVEVATLKLQGPDHKNWILFIIGNGTDIISDYVDDSRRNEGLRQLLEAFNPEDYA